MKSKRKLFMVLVVALIAIFAFASVAQAASHWNTFPITKKGQTNGYVRAVQTVIKYNYSDLTNDGIFGAGTETKVKGFQSSNSCTSDGIVGSTTWTKLMNKLYANLSANGYTYYKIYLPSGSPSGTTFVKCQNAGRQWEVYKAVAGTSTTGTWYSIN